MMIKMKVRYLFALAMAASIYSMTAVAQYSGPVTMPQDSVASILENPVDDQDVRLQGYLLRKTGSDKYIFSDGTGEIVAEIKSKRFPAQPVDEKTKVEIVGEVDTSLRRPPEIEVDAMNVIQ